MQQLHKVLVLAQTRIRVVGEADNEYACVCASAQKPYALVPYDIFCTYVCGVSVKTH